MIREQRIRYLDNFWDLYSKLPYETASFVPRFIAVLHIVQDPGAHGFVLPPIDRMGETESVTINKQVHLTTIAERVGISPQTLVEMNPELRKEVTPPTPYQLKVPSGKAEVLLGQLSDIPLWISPVSASVTHRVQKGETLSFLASTYGTSVKAIMAANGIKNSSYIKQGASLTIPVRGRVAVGSTIPVSTKGLEGKVTEYIVKKGDSLWTIANRFNTTTTTIQSLNQLNDTALTIGQTLMVPYHGSDG